MSGFRPKPGLGASFDALVMPVTESGCHLWIGDINDHGYGRFTIDYREYRAHRLAYEKARGQIPAGLQLDHLCRVRCCVNPLHLEAVTQLENNRRGVGWSGINARKKACVHGHPFDDGNTYRTAAGRHCKTCRREALRRFKARRNAGV